MSRRVTRRKMLSQSALVGAGAWLAAGPVAWTKGESPNEKLDIAVIGCANRGKANLDGVAKENIVALCDVDDRLIDAAAMQFPKARKYRDFRKMLDEMDRQIDAVVVSTADHTHAVATMRAMRAGKHCYCEKPLTHEVHEARMVAELAKQKKVATQMGTQIHAGSNYRRMVELIQSGAIGPVHEVYCWIGRSGNRKAGGGERPKDIPPVPPQLDWDLWLGPAPYRPYHPRYCPGAWRSWWDFGAGTMGDYGCHYLDLPFWALGLRYPTTVEAEGSPVNPEMTPSSEIARWEFPARGTQPAVKLTWSHGAELPPVLQQPGVVKEPYGICFVGEQGMLAGHYGWHRLLPEAKFAGFKPPSRTIPESIGHHEEWIAACKTGSPTTCNFDYAGALTETVLLGNVAFRTGKKLQWDPVALKAPNCPEADRYLKREYRQGWA
jgi:predicted dehydrogenase